LPYDRDSTLFCREKKGFIKIYLFLCNTLKNFFVLIFPAIIITTMNKNITISVSGARDSDYCGLESLQLGQKIGETLARHGCMVTCGAVTGFPLWVAKGVSRSNGSIIAFSPAVDYHEHITTYRLPDPQEYFDLVVYTGFGFSGSDLLMTRSSDAVIFGCGRTGTVHDFSLAFAEGKIIGVLEGDWQTDDLIREILKADVTRSHDSIIFDSDPVRLVDQIVKKVKQKKNSP
jgi:uncharacterized protein (TIGR00725 family)